MRIRDITKVSSFIYNELLEKKYKINDVARDMWQNELQVMLSIEDWEQLYIKTMNITKSTKS